MVSSWVSTLRGGVGKLCCKGTVFVGGVSFGGADIFKISVICF